jgi:hypothetical protein
MIRTTMDKAWIKRPYRVTYGWTQQTPNAVLLDPAWDRSIAIWPGMVAMKTKGDNVTLINGTGEPLGFFAEYIGGDGIDEPLERGVNATAVWIMAPDAEAEVLSPSFDTGASWVDPADGTMRRGKLAPAGTSGRGTLTAVPVCRLHRVDSATKIVVSGLHVSDAL